MAHALERTQEERERAEREKDALAMKISLLEAKLLTNADRIEDTDEFQQALDRERYRLSQEHASQAAEVNAERARLQEEKAAFERERLLWSLQLQQKDPGAMQPTPPPSPSARSPTTAGRSHVQVPVQPRPPSSGRARASRPSRRSSTLTSTSSEQGGGLSPGPAGEARVLAVSPPLRQADLHALQRHLSAEDAHGSVSARLQLSSDDGDSDTGLVTAVAHHDQAEANGSRSTSPVLTTPPPPVEGDGSDFWAPVSAARRSRLTRFTSGNSNGNPHGHGNTNDDGDLDDAGSAAMALSLRELQALLAQPVADGPATDRYRRALADPSTGLPRGSRRIRFSLYEDVFNGADAAGWFMAHMEGVDTLAQALAVGQTLIDLGVITPARTGKGGSNSGGGASGLQDAFQVGKNALFRLRATAADHDAVSQRGSQWHASGASSTGSFTGGSGSGANANASRLQRPSSGVSTRSTRSSVSSVGTFATAYSASSDGDTDDFFEQDEAATTASQLHVAAARGDIVALRALLPELSVELTDALGRTPLMYAIIANRGRACKLLLRRGAKVNVADAHGHTALLWAACRGNGDALKLLLSKGADLALCDRTGRTALHWACKIRRTACLEQLLRKAYRAAINAPDVEGQTPLHWAVLCGHAAHVVLLLRNQGDAARGDAEGRTPLHYAVNTSALTCLAALLAAHPAAANVADAMGRTPLHLACGESVAETPEAVAAAGGTAIDLLLATPGLSVGQCDTRGTTALHWAAVCDRVDVCEKLLAAGADATARDAAGNTAADYARDRDFLACLRVIEVAAASGRGGEAVGGRESVVSSKTEATGMAGVSSQRRSRVASARAETRKVHEEQALVPAATSSRQAEQDSESAAQRRVQEVAARQREQEEAQQREYAAQQREYETQQREHEAAVRRQQQEQVAYDRQLADSDAATAPASANRELQRPIPGARRFTDVIAAPADASSHAMPMPMVRPFSRTSLATLQVRLVAGKR